MLSLAVALVVQGVTLAWDTRPGLRRALTSPSLWPRVLLEQRPIAFMARH